MSLFINPTVRAVDADGDTLSGAKWYFYLSGTSTLAAVYSDSSLETEHANPVVADSGGLFAPIYLSGGVDYRAVLKTAAGVTIQDIDPYNPGGASTAGAFYDATANGLVGDAVGNTGTDNLAALNALIALVSANLEHNKPGGPVIWFPPGRYYFSGPINLKKQVTFIGGSNGMAGAGQSTVFVFPDDTRGIICNFDTTSNGDTIVASSGGADGSVFINLDLFGGGTDTTKHGIYSKVRIRLESCSARSFPGHGAYIAGDGNIAAPTTYGNANNTKITGGHYEGNGRCGICIEGGDTNNCVIIGSDCSYNGEYGIYDKSFLGIVALGVHTSENGILGSGHNRTLASVVTYSSDQWYVVPGQETAASTTAPGTDSTKWRRMIEAIGTRGTPSSVAPTWVSGTSYLAGGPYCSTSSGGANTGFQFCYAESGQPPSYVVSPAMVTGGTHGPGVDGPGTGLSPYFRMKLGQLLSGVGIGYEGTDYTNTLKAWVGGDFTNGYALSWSLMPAWGAWHIGHIGGSNQGIYYGSGLTAMPFFWTGEDTTKQFGTGAAVPYKLVANAGLCLADDTDGRNITQGSAAPTTGAHARGEIVFRNNPSAGGKIGWVCTTAGTPGTWKEWGVIDA